LHLLNKQTHEPILIVSATRLEIEPLMKRASSLDEKEDGLFRISVDANVFNLLITGVGIPSATYEIASFFASNIVPFAIHLGIAGSYKDEIANGKVVMIVEDEFGELGMDQASKFGTLFETGLSMPNHLPFTSGKLINKLSGKIHLPETLIRVKGLTVNVLTSDKTIIQNRKEKYCAEIETMESAAFFYCCLKNGIPFLSLRGISNKAGEGNKSNWLISESIQNVCETMIQILQKNNYFINET
jgi:futalosine hydrolase